MIDQGELNLNDIRVLLCDADGNLFPSEEPAFVASAEVTNRFLEHFGVARRYAPTELRLATAGKNFRATAVDLLVEAGVPIAPQLAVQHAEAVVASGENADDQRVLTDEELQWWVREERQHVTAYLGEVLRPDPDVIDPLTRLADRYLLAVVSSSATPRLRACLAAAGLERLFPKHLTFSAEDSLRISTSKPDPAVYLMAAATVGVPVSQGLAVEDSAPGVQSAVAAGFTTIGNIMFVPPSERARRVEELANAGAVTIIAAWRELVTLLVDATA